jgi:hypothetical protein
MIYAGSQRFRQERKEEQENFASEVQGTRRAGRAGGGGTLVLAWAGTGWGAPGRLAAGESIRSDRGGTGVKTRLRRVRPYRPHRNAPAAPARRGPNRPARNEPARSTGTGAPRARRSARRAPLRSLRSLGVRRSHPNTRVPARLRTGGYGRFARARPARKGRPGRTAPRRARSVASRPPGR